MDDNKEKPGWMSVPQFGAWDEKCNVPDYSMDFTKIRESRKQNKKDFSRASIGNEEELAVPHHHDHNDHVDHQQQVQLPVHSPTRRRKILSCFNCCVKA